MQDFAVSLHPVRRLFFRKSNYFTKKSRDPPSPWSTEFPASFYFSKKAVLPAGQCYNEITLLPRGRDRFYKKR